jgi:hypothetical protein
MKSIITRQISEYQPHLLHQDSLFNETIEKSHYEKLYTLELEMKLLEEKMNVNCSGVISIYKNLTSYIYKKFEVIDMLFTRLDYIDKKQAHDVLEDIDEKLAQLEDKVGTLKRFFKDQ